MQTAQFEPLDNSTQQSFLQQNIDTLKQPVIVAGAPGGIVLSTPHQTLQIEMQSLKDIMQAG